MLHAGQNVIQFIVLEFGDRAINHLIDSLIKTYVLAVHTT